MINKIIKKYCLLSLVTAGIFTVNLASSVSAAPPRNVTWSKTIAPGDILVVTDTDKKVHSVRLYGIACPMDDLSITAKVLQFIKTSLTDQPVTLDVVAEDSDGLPVAWVRTGDGSSLNEQLVAKGLAWWDALNAPLENPLKKVSAEALRAGTGLWNDPVPLAPWDYRISHNLPEVRYTVGEKPNVAAAPTETETPTLAAKGTAKPQPAARPMAPVALAPEAYLGLVTKHQPRIARDKEGKALGLTANDIASIPGAGQIGFQNGDVVRSVNGIPLTSEGQVMGLVGQLQGAKQIQVEVVRGGTTVVINIPL